MSFPQDLGRPVRFLRAGGTSDVCAHGLLGGVEMKPLASFLLVVNGRRGRDGARVNLRRVVSAWPTGNSLDVAQGLTMVTAHEVVAIKAVAVELQIPGDLVQLFYPVRRLADDRAPCLERLGQIDIGHEAQRVRVKIGVRRGGDVIVVRPDTSGRQRQRGRIDELLDALELSISHYREELAPDRLHAPARDQRATLLAWGWVIARRHDGADGDTGLALPRAEVRWTWREKDIGVRNFEGICWRDVGGWRYIRH